jgi:hypothetical protein
LDIVARMGFLDRFFGGGTSSKKPASPPLPESDYALMWVPGKEAVARALELRSEWSGSATPVIIGTQESFSCVTDLWGEEGFLGAQEYLDAAAKFNLEKWLAERNSEMMEAGEEYPEFLQQIYKASDWDTGAGSGADFTVPREILSGRFHAWVLIAKVPTARAYEVPAYLKYGNWNANPEASIHVALWKKWQAEYGAEILCVSGDVIEATVSRPPLEKEECYKLAREQFAYCEDIVTQGVGSIDALAATLRKGMSWYFWWD